MDEALYVMVGSAGNVDTQAAERATRLMIRRFAPGALPAEWPSGEVFATGLRNEAGLTVDRAGRMWGMENGRDDLQDPRFGGDIHVDNPGEELSRFDGPVGAFYGYPW